MSKLKLKNGVTYAIEDYAVWNNFIVLLGSAAVEEVIGSLTEENLSEIQFLTDEGLVTGVYMNKLLCDYVDNGDMIEVRINDADLCRHGLTLDEGRRIVSAAPQRYAHEYAAVVDKLPEGNLSDYLFVNGEFVYDPLPQAGGAEYQPTQEERIAALEEENAVMLECLLEMSEIVYA